MSEEVKWKTITVKENGQEMEVFVPDMGDSHETADLMENAEGRTREQLKKKIKKEPMFKKEEDRVAFLKDVRAYTERGKKYF